MKETEKLRIKMTQEDLKKQFIFDCLHGEVLSRKRLKNDKQFIIDIRVKNYYLDNDIVTYFISIENDIIYRTEFQTYYNEDTKEIIIEAYK